MDFPVLRCQQIHYQRLSLSQHAKHLLWQDWLHSSCQRIRAGTALLVVQQGKKLKPLACVPAIAAPETALLQVAIAALKEKKVLIRESDHTASELSATKRSVCVGLSLRIAGRPAAVVFRILVSASDADSVVLQRVAALTLRRAEDRVQSAELATEQNSSISKPTTTSLATNVGALPIVASDTALESNAITAQEVASQLVAEQGSLLGSVAALIDQSDLDQSLHALACRLAQQFRCLRVYIGCVVGKQIAIRAVSGLVDFDPRSALMVDVVQAMNETRMLASAIRVPEPEGERVPPQSHASLAEQLNNPALMSVPWPLTTRWWEFCCWSVIDLLM